MFASPHWLFLALFCSALAHAETEKINTGFFSRTAVKGYDVVAYFSRGQAIEGDKAHALDYKGARWLFSNAHHREMFRRDPARYEPQFGGYCAYAVAAKHKLVGIDPQAWSIVDGKLYLNYSAKVRSQWEQNLQEYILEARRIWPAIGFAD